MGLPPFREMLEPLLRVLADAPEGIAARRAQDLVADLLQLTAEERELRVPSGTQLLFRHRTNWAHDRLKRALLSSNPRRGVWQITGKGLDLVCAHPISLGNDKLRALANTGRDVRIETCAPGSLPKDQGLSP